MAILLFHKSNFKVKNVKKDNSALESEGTDISDDGTQVNVYRETEIENEVLIRTSLMKSNRQTAAGSNLASVNKQTPSSIKE